MGSTPRLRNAVAGLLLGAAATVLPGCSEQVFKEKFAPNEIDYYDDLYAASAVGSNHFWAAGYFGAIYRTRDGGKSFEKLPTGDGNQKSLYGISFADEKNGWVVGRNGYIMHTSDGGDTWERQTTPRSPAQHIFAVHAIDTQTAWAVGEWGGRYRTADGGKTWQDLSFTIDESHPSFRYLTDFEIERYRAGEVLYDDLYLNDVYFIDPDHGWIIGEYGLIYRTDDGGKTWQKGEILGELKLDDFPFESMSATIPRERWPLLFAAAEKLKEMEWLRVRIEGFLTQKELDAKGDTVLSDERGEAIRDFFEGEGVSQERIRLHNTTPFDRETVDMKAYAKSKLQPTSMAHIEVLETPFLFDVKFRDRDHGMVAALGGVILLTDDGGRTWRYAKTDVELAFFAVGLGSQVAVAVGERGQFRVSLDGGASWQRSNGSFPELFVFMRDLSFSDPDHGWIVGAGGRVFKTADGGQSWAQVLPAGAVTEAVSIEGGGE